MALIIGLSGSLRNARFGAGSRDLVKDIASLNSREELIDYLHEQTKIRVDDFIAAGRGENRSFDEIYRELVRAKGDRGLSNSEAALVAALWGAHQEGCEIAHCGLARYFPMSGVPQDLDGLRDILLKADGILLAGPVYFGDRSSVAQEFVEFLRRDPEVFAHIRNKVYGGVVSGAKRNGGQETTLIYQIVDMTNLNMLAVGNDSETTSQYGGTVVAGDVGTAWKDDYGLNTSIGTGRRLARVSNLLDRGQGQAVNDEVNIAVWLLQDHSDHRGRDYFQNACDSIEKEVAGVKFQVLDFTDEEIRRCIACDICPTDPGDPMEYRCIIGSDRDLFKKDHTKITGADAILTAAYSPFDRSEVNSVYQRFTERTRYIRRDDYLIGDRLTAPWVISEVNSNQNLHIRMLTSLVRHHTVLHHPLIGFEHNGALLNSEEMLQQGVSFAHTARQLTAGRISRADSAASITGYKPVGYEISSEKTRTDIESGATGEAQQQRREKLSKQRARLKV